MERPLDLVKQLEFEILAGELRGLARLGDDDLELAPQIAARILGSGGVVFGAIGTSARLEGDQIVVPPDHPDLNFAVAHELAEWGLRELVRFKGSHIDKERAANSVGAALLAPRNTMLRAHAHYGERLRSIANTFALSQTGVVLRLAEVCGDERAVVTASGNVLVRTQGVFPWADVPVVSVARGARWRGLAKTSLRGGIDEGRVALRAR